MTKGYQYKGCGLDYVYLVNGYEEHDTSHGKGVSITDADGLHRAIAIEIITGDRLICGQEVRFLRSMLDLPQEGLARILGVQRLQVLRWEKERRKPISGPANVALRLFVAGSVVGDTTVSKLIELLKEQDEKEYKECIKTSKISFKETPRGWRPIAA